MFDKSQGVPKFQNAKDGQEISVEEIKKTKSFFGDLAFRKDVLRSLKSETSGTVWIINLW